jgi:hypothetical protein
MAYIIKRYAIKKASSNKDFPREKRSEHGYKTIGRLK